MENDKKLQKRKIRAHIYSLVKPFGVSKENWEEKCKELENKEKERIALADELHARNLEYLTLLDKIKSRGDGTTVNNHPLNCY